MRFLTAGVFAMLLQSVALPALADEDSGAYLAARQARIDHDFAAAAQYFTQALTQDLSNPAIMENAAFSFLALGDVDKAVPVSRRIDEAGLKSQIAFMALIANGIKQAEYDAVISQVNDERGIGTLADSLVAAWAQIGNGNMDAALAGFDAISQQRGLKAFALYHKALALAFVGDFESADAIFAGRDDAPLQRTRRGVVAWAEILSQLERREDAIALLDDAFGENADPEVAQLRAELEQDAPVPFRRVTSVQDGVAEVFYSIGQALLSDTGEDYTLLYARIAEYLDPDHVDAVLMAAQLLGELERHELATETYRRVPSDHPAFTSAEMGRAESLRRLEKIDAAIEVLEALQKSHPALPLVHVSTGDLYRQDERYQEAIDAYDDALSLFGERASDQWFVYYARAISYERLGVWENAEADFRAALELNPEHPQVLNYLGYSLVEKQIKLDEALSMIERAVERQPDSGYIVDSLGWVLYRLGRYEEAVGHMERAAELMPVDPVVNDHLGDVLWAVGRTTEAEFQWKRALSFIVEETQLQDIDPDRIRRKLEVGLDVVLAEEGAPALKVAGEDG
ncbi:MAG: tetratricopeptide repeat protein [Pseudomonadota bacterium]